MNRVFGKFNWIASHGAKVLLIASMLMCAARASEQDSVRIELNGTTFRIPTAHVGFMSTAGISLYATLPDLRVPSPEDARRYNRQQIFISIDRPPIYTAEEHLVGWINISRWSHVGHGQEAVRWRGGELIKGDRETANAKTWLWDMYRLPISGETDSATIFCSQVRPTASNTTCTDALVYKSLLVKFTYQSGHLEQWADIRRKVRDKLDLWSGSNRETK